ncbi:MAG: plastocyanin/azurin family copper-binding protein [Candidatus Nitrosocosmicus sp.]|nr:plastocyanin/azurin family copper-binding protein [Candidatus Nitrosocosmicus sp.]MDN5868621.1 plastocyanin/azurin family copper-binding protein [Candidatus Nitrosocosmicus sp.]
MIASITIGQENMVIVVLSFIMTLIFCIGSNSGAYAQQDSINTTDENGVRETLNTTRIPVSIPPGASLLTETAYDPNPIEITVGQSILWTNDDPAFHTVTSGEAGESDSGQIFDSGLTGPNAMISKGKTFEHKFDMAGEYPYYCILHPGMEGTVIVS